MVKQPSRIHARGYVDGIAPDVILWLAGAYHTSHHRADVDACVMTDLVPHLYFIELAQTANQQNIYICLNEESLEFATEDSSHAGLPLP